jgi:hypothetical protein
MNAPSLLFAYFGPETVLPMTSVVATVVGLAMMFGRHTIRLFVRCCRLILIGSSRAILPPRRLYSGPHKGQTGVPRRRVRSMISADVESREEAGV